MAPDIHPFENVTLVCSYFESLLSFPSSVMMLMVLLLPE